MFDEACTETSRQIVVKKRIGRRSISLAAMLAVFVSSVAFANDLDSENLRGLAQTEIDAGQVTTVHVVEAYHVLGISMSHHRIPRAWGAAFCASATRNFVWDRTWTVMVYGHQQEQPSYSCQIGSAPNR
jgi:hypothetical protein